MDAGFELDISHELDPPAPLEPRAAAERDGPFGTPLGTPLGTTFLRTLFEVVSSQAAK